jgi:hypothetical protein
MFDTSSIKLEFIKIQMVKMILLECKISEFLISRSHIDDAIILDGCAQNGNIPLPAGVWAKSFNSVVDRKIAMVLEDERKVVMISICVNYFHIARMDERLNSPP